MNSTPKKIVVTITGFDLSDYEQCMKKWNDAIFVMYQKCLKIGPKRCMIVYYEQLVLHPKAWTERILKFLDIHWDEAVLHHDEHINKPGGVVLSKVERSSDQVIKPINLEALTKWVGQFPEHVLKKVHRIAPMLSRLGYDPHKVPPNYGLPDAFVQNNTDLINSNKELWINKAKNLSVSVHLASSLFMGKASETVAQDVTVNMTTTKDDNV